MSCRLTKFVNVSSMSVRLVSAPGKASVAVRRVQPGLGRFRDALASTTMKFFWSSSVQPMPASKSPVTVSCTCGASVWRARAEFEGEAGPHFIANHGDQLVLITE